MINPALGWRCPYADFSAWHTRSAWSRSLIDQPTILRLARSAYFSDRGRSFRRDRGRRFGVIVDDQRGVRATGFIVS
jgi:hypothetical protein